MAGNQRTGLVSGLILGALLILSFVGGAVSFQKNDAFLENQFTQLSWLNRMQSIQIRTLTAKVKAKQNGMNSSEDLLKSANTDLESLKKELASTKAELDAANKRIADLTAASGKK